MQRPTRRSVLQSAAAGGALGLAGCLSAAGSEDAPRSNETPADEPTAGATETTPVADRAPLEEWLLASNVFSGPADRHFADEVSVTVGSAAVPYAFAPADLRVTPGTTVEWQWLPHGGANNVVAVDGSFHSGDPVDGHEHTFRQTFEEPGIHRYVSEPHEDCGMRGVVRVETVPESAYPAVDRWLADVDAYEGTVADRTDASAVTVTVGAAGNGGHFAFDPMAVKLSPGTTVTWEWTGEGGAHDVAFEDADLGTGEVVAEAGATYSHTFESTGVYRYACRPHQALGQKGAIVVE